MTAQQLIRLYPRRWRDRYGEEFEDVVGKGRVSVQQAIDIMAGAVDAWMSPRVRASVRGSAVEGNSGGVAMIQALKMKCATSKPRYTKRDSLISAAVLIGLSLVFVVAGTAARRSGYDDLSEFVLGLAFPASVLLSMPFALTKGQSLRAQAFFILVPLAIVTVMAWLAVKL